MKMNEGTRTKKFTAEQIIAEAKHKTDYPAVRPYGDRERTIVSAMELSTGDIDRDYYRRHFAFLVCSWINTARYNEALTMGTITAEPFRYLNRATQMSRDRFMAHLVAESQIGMIQQVHDIQNLPSNIGSVEADTDSNDISGNLVENK